LDSTGRVVAIRHTTPTGDQQWARQFFEPRFKKTDRNAPVLLENAPGSFDVAAPKRRDYSAMMLD
jgi:hypothetical protein